MGLLHPIERETVVRFLFSLIAPALALCLASPASADPALFVYSTIDALLAGAYEGDLTVQELGTKGDFGMGTYNRLDGEMVLLNGVFYHVRADGTVSVADPRTKVPLAYVLPFAADAARGFSFGDAAPPKPLAELEAIIDKQLPNKNLFFGVKVAGRFASMSTRAIAAQVRPYKPLAEVVKTQTVFTRAAVAGTLVGLRSPAFSKGISQPGWHWHFVSDDKSFGGHVLAANVVAGSVAITQVEEVTLKLPTSGDFANADQARDRSGELQQVQAHKP